MIHIGQRIKEIFDQQPKNHNIEWFADKLHCKRSNIYNIFSRSTIDTDLLFHISKILGHDFFRDLTVELYRFNSDDRNEKQEIYEDIMHSIGQLLNRKLGWLALPENLPYHYRLNDDDSADSSLPPSQYIVSVKSGEERDSEPHIHIISKEENFELTYGLNTHGKVGVMNVINYGKRPFTDSFSDVIALIDNWLIGYSNSSAGHIDNQTYAAIAYSTLNSIE